MPKLPFFMFNPSDWLRDTGGLSPKAKAVWIDILAYAWNEPKRGVYERSRAAFCSQLRVDPADLISILSELTSVANLTASNEKITVISRRMVEVEKAYEDNRIRQQRFYYNAKANGNLTHKTLDVRSKEKEKKEKDVIEKEKNEREKMPLEASPAPAHPKGLSLGPTSEPKPTYSPPKADLSDPLVQKQLAAQDYTARVRAKVKAQIEREKLEKAAAQDWEGI